jgi:hypothetical protein
LMIYIWTVTTYDVESQTQRHITSQFHTEFAFLQTFRQ